MLHSTLFLWTFNKEENGWLFNIYQGLRGQFLRNAHCTEGVLRIGCLKISKKFQPVLEPDWSAAQQYNHMFQRSTVNSNAQIENLQIDAYASWFYFDECVQSHDFGEGIKTSVRNCFQWSCSTLRKKCSELARSTWLGVTELLLFNSFALMAKQTEQFESKAKESEG